MTASTPVPTAQNSGSSGIFNSPTYRLVAAKLKRDPADFIAELRETDPPTPYARIADKIRELTNEYVTDEIPRRWYLERQRLNGTSTVPTPPAGRADQ